MSPVRNSQPSKLLTRASTGAISNGVKRLVSRYRPRFVRSLVYMLQASEYDIRDYLAWVHRASDFAHVEKRKTLVWSTKAKTLYAAAWASIVLWIVAVTGVANFAGSGIALAVDAFALLLTPFLLPYMLALLVVAGKVVQTPVEQTLIAQAKRKLRAHHAVKIAIAGSYGKTSMREILKTVLAEGKKVAAPPGSYNTPLGISKFVRGLKGDEDVLIFELGEYYPGDISKLCELVRPQWGIITGVNEAHLEKFGTLEKTASTIFELLDWLKKKPVFTRKGEHM
ncbi:MAG: Mur ligase family protein, partial [Patescibacteria group bacterium]|nr:Mur ligase family protein [Patescibacteria group bacterium]